MPSWKKVIVSGSQAELAAVTSSIAVLVGTNQQITTSPSTTFLSGSFSGSFRGDGSNITGISATNATTATTAVTASNTTITNTTAGTLFFPTFVASGSGHQPQLVDSGSFLYNATSKTLTVTSSFATTASFAQTASYILNAISSSFAATASFVNTLTQLTVNGPMTASQGLSVQGNLTVSGVITGSATIITATNVAIQDQFILLASGSGATVDAGIIVQNGANVGEALYWENNPTGVGRWSLSSSVSPTSITVTAAEYLVSAQIGTSNPSANPYYGGGVSGSGNMFINNTSGDIFIFA